MNDEPRDPRTDAVEALRELRDLLVEVKGGGVPHDHTTYVDGCFRCDLNRDELGVDPSPDS